MLQMQPTQQGMETVQRMEVQGLSVQHVHAEEGQLRHMLDSS